MLQFRVRVQESIAHSTSKVHRHVVSKERVCGAELAVTWDAEVVNRFHVCGQLRFGRELMQL